MRRKFKEKTTTRRYTFKVQINRKINKIEDHLRHWQRRKKQKYKKFPLHKCRIIKISSPIGNNERNPFIPASYPTLIDRINSKKDGK